MITTTKFTDGPWGARPDKNSSCEWEVVKTEASLPDGAWFIADVHDGPDGCSSEANARLIAAAPELYAACAALIAAHDANDVPAGEIAVAEMRAALAKSGAVA